MKTGRQSRYHIIAFLLIIFSALFIRGYYNTHAEVFFPIRADTEYYVNIATNLQTHGIYSKFKDSLTNEYSIWPGYPLLLAITTCDTDSLSKLYYRGLTVNQILGALSAGFVFLGVIIHFGATSAFIAALAVVISPHLISSGIYLLTEVPFIFWLLSGFLCLSLWLKDQKTYWLIAAGLLWGITTMTRPAWGLYPIVCSLVVIYLYNHGKRLKSSLKIITLLVLPTGLMVFGWNIMGSMEESHTTRERSSYLAEALMFGSYPDFIYNDPELRGNPYHDDPEYKIATRNVASALETIINRATDEPLRYSKWYLIGKPVTYWSPDIISGAGDIFIYPMIRTPFIDNRLWSSGKIAFKAIHPVIIIVALIVFPFIAWRNKQLSATAGGKFLWIIWSACIYATIIHTVLAPLPRYSIPFYSLAYPLAMVTMVYIVQNYVVPGAYLHASSVMYRRRNTLREKLINEHDDKVLEETCVPSYCHRNIFAAHVAWTRLTLAVYLGKKYARKGTWMDFGAGSGELLRLLPEDIKKIAIEQDPVMKNHISRNMDDVVIRSLDEVTDSSIDCVFALDSLEHNADYSKIIDQLIKTIKPGGYLVLSGPTENMLYRFGRRLAGFHGHYHITTIYDIEKNLHSRLECIDCFRLPLGIPLFNVSIWKNQDGLRI